ncbi:MAG: penicillin acylase family protein, partial [Ilumatobacter sp.]
TTTTTSSTTTTSTTTTTTTTTAVPPTFEANIRRTTDGVPHITGRNRADLAYGQGYVSGGDYGCTLMDQILKVEGERARNLGPGDNGQNVDSDFAWRAIGIAEIAARDFEAASPEVVEQFSAFSAGWNQFLRDQGDVGLSGWCVGETWVRPIEPVEVYTYARSVALLASGANFLDFIARAQPPAAPAAETGVPADGTRGRLPAGTGAVDFGVLGNDDLGSNAWGIGSERTETGEGGILVANPHFPWEGELRFAETHLTVPGEIDIYGAQLTGLPGIGIGFTDGVAWSHTVSAGHRFTAYSLTLDPASPTSYLVDGVSRPMTATDHVVEILRPDGTVDTETRTLYASEYGPIIDFPNVGWTDQQVLTYRDANIDNDEFVEFYSDLLDVEDLADLRDTTARHQGVPLFNTVAVGASGETWYADTSATPNLSAEAEQIYLAQRLEGGLAGAAFAQGVILLDGSDSRFRWEEVDGARDPGLVPFEEQPRALRTDYVFNANDSFWVPSAEFQLSGDYSVLHGEQNVPLSMRTRQNAAVLSDANPLQLAGPDGNWTADELRTAAFDNTAGTARLLREKVVELCRFVPLVEVDELLAADGTVALPAEAVDLTAACDVLSAWDGRFDLSSSGALLWREVLARFDASAFTSAGPLFDVAFDPAQPYTTPGGFTVDGTAILQALARGVQTLVTGGFAVDSTLGTAQFTERSGERIPLHGGTNSEGVTNVVSWSDSGSSTEPAPTRGDVVAPGGALRGNGHPVNFGTSFVLVVDYTAENVQASAILTYGQTGLRDSPLFGAQTVRFSEKNWRTVAFTDEQILADPGLSEVTVSQP